jgi:molybdopterin synthase catalytic subunit
MLSDKVSSLSLQLKLIERQAENYELFHNVLERMKQQVPVSKISIFEEKLNRFMNGLQL